MTDEIVHIAGNPVQVGTHLRQRCAWCGAVMIDQDLALTMVQIPEDGSEPASYPTWGVGELIARNGLDGSMVSGSWVVEHEAGQPVPDGCCAKLGPEVTV